MRSRGCSGATWVTHPLVMGALLTGALLFGGVDVALAQQPGGPPVPSPGAPPPAAPAKEPTKEEIESAKKAFGEGRELFDEKKWEEALAKFQEADRLWPKAAPKHKIAVTLDNLGRTREAVAAYKAYTAAEDDREKFAERIEASNTRVAELEALLPGVITLAITPPDAAGLKVTVDGVAVEAVEGAWQLELEPGDHTVVVSAEGFEASTQQVTVKGSETRALPVTLAEVAPPPEPAPAPAPPPPPPPPEEKSNVPAYVTIGIAGAGVVLGTVFGVLALGAKSDFDENPNVDDADKTERFALISDMSFGVALTFGITGAVLLFSGNDEPEAPAASGRPAVTPYAGPTGGGLVSTWTF